MITQYQYEMKNKKLICYFHKFLFIGDDDFTLFIMINY